MSLEPLRTFPVGELPRIDAGPPPRMEWLAIGQLGIESDYQRPVTAQGRKTIEKIARGFDWAQFSPVIVRPVGKDRFAVIDGQHRTTAALIRGYEKVPAYIVAADGARAARIFAAVNGTVTRLSSLAIYKAGLAGAEDWALAVQRVSTAAGVSVLLYPVAASQMRPHQTLAVSTIRQMIAIRGEDETIAALKLFRASKGSEKPGAWGAKRILACGNLITAHPGWLRDVDRLCHAASSIDFQFGDYAACEARLVKQLGDGRGDSVSWRAIVARVHDLKTRRLSPQMIAAQLRLPYAEVERALLEKVA